MLKDTAPKPTPGTIAGARKLRRAMSLPEGLLWRELRRRPGGCKFRRQHASGPYICDFYCADARLVIEVDGEAHNRGDRPERDAGRNRWFAEHGLATLRLPAVLILTDLDAAVRHIVNEAHARLPLHHSAAPSGPPPRGELGEE